MILINVKFPVREDKMDEWLALADSYSKAVNAEEGCVSFSFSRSLDDPNLFVCVELFRDAEAGGAHVKTEHAVSFFNADFRTRFKVSFDSWYDELLSSTSAPASAVRRTFA